MQIILASAKIMHAREEMASVLQGLHLDEVSAASSLAVSTPRFEKDAEKVALELSSMSPETLSQLLHCNMQLALENHHRYQLFFNAEERLPALLAYYGQAYKYLKAETLSADDFAFAQQHLFITSFLYGLLRPLDSIHPYRLEAKVKLQANGMKSMFAYWKEKLTDVLIDTVKADDGILVHLATEEYEHLFDWKRVEQEVRVVHPYFMQDKGDVLKMVTVHAKSCRGAMARYIIEHRITDIEGLQGFELNGYRYRPNYGDDHHPHFVL